MQLNILLLLVAFYIYFQQKARTVIQNSALLGPWLIEPIGSTTHGFHKDIKNPMLIVRKKIFFPRI